VDLSLERQIHVPKRHYGGVGTLSRWVRYGRAKLDDMLKQDNEELDRLEAERKLDAAERPWAHSTGEVPTLDEVRQRIDPGAPPTTPDQERVELDAQRREAEARLTKIREELGLGRDEQPPDA
jgi:hypothetical protein